MRKAIIIFIRTRKNWNNKLSILKNVRENRKTTMDHVRQIENTGYDGTFKPKYLIYDLG